MFTARIMIILAPPVTAQAAAETIARAVANASRPSGLAFALPHTMEGFVPDLSDHTYVEQLKARMQDRLHYVDSLDAAEGGFNKLPDDAGEAIRKVVDQANSL